MEHRIHRLGEELNGLTLQGDKPKHKKKMKSSLAEQRMTSFLPFRWAYPSHSNSTPLQLRLLRLQETRDPPYAEAWQMLRQMR